MKRVLLAALLLFSTSAFAADETFAPNGIALQGTDVVAYQSLQPGSPAVKGSPQFKATHNGVTYQFASQENLTKFQANPQQYQPEFGGYCALGMAEKGQKMASDPNSWTIHNGKLYLTNSSSTQQTWAQNIDKNIQQANANWSKAQSQPFTSSSY